MTRRHSVAAFVALLPAMYAGLTFAQLDTGPAGDAPFRALPPPRGTDGEPALATILQGRWGDSSGKDYSVSNGAFSRDGYRSLQITCERKTDVESITPLYTCSGEWYNRKGEVKGNYLGTLYWEGSRQRWYLEGTYNDYSSPQGRYGWNLSPFETAPASIPALYRKPLAETIGPVDSDALGILTGHWGSSSGKEYDVTRGYFVRDQRVAARLTCRRQPADDSATPSFECGGDLHNVKGEVVNGYTGKLYWQKNQKRWYIEGKYNYPADAARWYGLNFAQITGADGAPPSPQAAGGAPPAAADTYTPNRAGNTPDSGSDSNSVPIDEIVTSSDGAALRGCLKSAHAAFTQNGLKVDARSHTSLIGHDANHTVRVRCPTSESNPTTSVTVIATGDNDPTALRDRIVGALQP